MAQYTKITDLGRLTFVINVTLDGCCDHREMTVDDEGLEHGDLQQAVTRLKETTPKGVLVGSPVLSATLEQLGLIDEYHLVIHPVLAGHGPSLFQGLERSRHLDLVSTTRLTSGVTAMHYRRKAG